MRTHGEKGKPEWNLHPLVQDARELARIQSQIRKKTDAFTRHRHALETKPTREHVEKVLAEMEEISLLGARISIYATLRFAQDTQDEEAKALQGKIAQFLAEQGNKKVFFGVWWNRLDDATAQKLLPRNPEYAYHLKDMRRFRSHTLSEKEEQLANLKDTTGSEALVRLYELRTNGYEYPWTTRGKKTRITEEELGTYHRSPDPRTRKHSYDLRWAQYQKDNGLLGEIYSNIVHDVWNEAISIRKYDSPISIRNMDNHLPDDVVEKFLSICTKNTDVFQAYFAWKAQTVGVENSRYHIYAPLRSRTTPYPFEKGYALVRRTFKEFDPWFADLAHRVRAEKKMDFTIRPGKQGGGFCMDVPHETSYVHLNYANTLQEVSVLAHELGHAVHHHAAGKHSLYTMHTALPLAETASTFAELLVSDTLAREATSSEVKRNILAHQLDEGFASIPRQAFFCTWEQEAFDLVHAGKTVLDLNDAYMKSLRAQLGKRMQIPEAAQYEWTSIPHFFVHPFYVYAYAFGQLLVYALYDRYQREGASFVQDYRAFLSAGGSKDPEKILLDIGFDPRKRKSWQDGFDMLEKKLQILQKMAD